MLRFLAMTMPFLLAQLSADVSNATKRVATDAASQSQNQIFEMLTMNIEYLWKIPGALILLIAFYLLGKIVAGRITKLLRQSKGDALAEDMVVFVNRFSVVGALTIGLALVLQFIFGIDFLQVVGFFALGISFAFKDLLENLIAGAVIIIQNTLRIGDFIQLGANGVKGKIMEIQTRQTIIKGIDGSAIIVPNSQMMSSTVISYTLHHTRKISFPIQIDYDTDLKKATEIALELMNKKDHVLKHPKPQVLIASISNSIVKLSMHFWIDPSDKAKSWLITKSELVAEVKEAFDKAGILIPYQTYSYLDKKRELRPPQ